MDDSPLTQSSSLIGNQININSSSNNNNENSLTMNGSNQSGNNNSNENGNNNNNNNNNSSNGQDKVGHSYTMPGILHYIQHEWNRFEFERQQWELEKSELMVRLFKLIEFKFIFKKNI
jgi:hypothetical protein